MGDCVLHQGDCLEVMRGMDACSVDAVVTDPPYHLTNNGGGPHGKGLGNAFARAQAGAGSGGFMGMKWDGGNIAQDPAMWAEALRVLKPGGYLLAFSGTRTQHRMVCAIEDAGFEIRDQIGWAYGSGFPKSYNGPWGGTALKPAWEPICLARKPLIGTVQENWREHGTGALNIDGCRIAISPDVDDARLGGAGTWSSDKMAKNVYEGGYAGRRVGSSELGRWPANLIHDGSDEVVALFPREAWAFAPVRGTEPSGKTSGIYGGGLTRDVPQPFHSDTGSAARFFYCAKASRDDRNDGCEHMERKALNWSSGTQNPGSFQSEGTDKTSQNHHPTVKPTDLMRYLCRLVTPAGGVILDPFMGSGSTGRGALLEGFGFIGIEREAEYMAIARARIDSARRQGHQPGLDLAA